MKKTLLYRLFGMGSVPKNLRDVLDQEGVVVLDEGIGGWLVTQNLNAPGKRSRRRREGFSGWFAVTRARVICYTFQKRQINISTQDPGISHLYVDTPEAHRLQISFESSHFHEGWQGVVEFSFRTDKALMFRDALLAIGARQGSASEIQDYR